MLALPKSDQTLIQSIPANQGGFIDDSQLEFNEKAPFESIAAFSNGRHWLPLNDQAKFILQMWDFFKELAYYDQSVEIPEAFKERFSKIDLPNLLGALPQVLKDANLNDAQRMLATIEKVTSTHFSAFAGKYQVYQLNIKFPAPDEEPIANAWGWVGCDDAASHRLMAALHPEFGSHAFDESIKGYGKAEFDNIKRITIKNYLTALTMFQNKQSPFIYPVGNEAAATKTSRFFDPDKPFESIARFVDRFSVLDNEEHNQLFWTIYWFFSRKAVKNEHIEIPPSLLERFSVVDLPFLIDHFPEGEFDKHPFIKTQYEKHRLIAAIQQATKKRFVNIPFGDQLFTTRLQYNSSSEKEMNISTGWLKWFFVKDSNLCVAQPFPQSKVRGCVDGDPIVLDGITPLLSLALQQLQYFEDNSPELEAAGYVESALELLGFAKMWKMERLKESIRGFIGRQSRGSGDKQSKEFIEFSTACGKFLHKSGVISALIEIGIDYLRPDPKGLSSEELSNVLRFNIEYSPEKDVKTLEQIVSDVLGGDFHRFIKVGGYARESYDQNMIKGIDSNIWNQCTNRCRRLWGSKDPKSMFVAELFKSLYSIANDYNSETHDCKDFMEELLKNHLMPVEEAEEILTIFSETIMVDLFQLLDAEGLRKSIADNLSAYCDV